MDKVSLARELAALAQTGLHYTKDPFDRERYQRLREISNELLADASNLDEVDIIQWRTSEHGYATPKVGVRAFILQDDKVFLVHEDADPGRWTLPGGWADVNEPPSYSVIREVMEESGYEVEVKQLMAVLDREKQGHIPPHPYHMIKLFFHCEIVGGSPQATLESSQSGFFAIDDLPDLSLSRVLPGQIRMLYEMIANEDSTTKFD
ncbi:MAG: NUDIX hydrolase [Chloroflexota bacterium]